VSPADVTDDVRLVSVNVALPQPLGLHRGRPVRSGIAKEAVAAGWLRLDRLNLEGDGQADLTVHGGPDKAVYAYPSEHLPAWSEELGETLAPGAFGENLTTEGWVEDGVRIGDQWAWGEALLEVCQPRWPCFKLAMHRRRGDIGRRLRDSGRTGWYLRVLRPGQVPVGGPLRVVSRHPVAATVRDVHEAARPGRAISPQAIEALLALPPLADEWKLMLADRLAG
jgi:MOSC domain-containing protein YiiM